MTKCDFSSRTVFLLFFNFKQQGIKFIDFIRIVISRVSCPPRFCLISADKMWMSYWLQAIFFPAIEIHCLHWHKRPRRPKPKITHKFIVTHIYLFKKIAHKNYSPDWTRCHYRHSEFCTVEIQILNNFVFIRVKCGWVPTLLARRRQNHLLELMMINRSKSYNYTW